MYTLKKIKSILEMNNFPKEIIEKINTNILMSKVWESVYLFKSKMKLIGKKRTNSGNNENRINEEKEEKKRGRISLENDDERVGTHNKDSPDNIIKVQIISLKNVKHYFFLVLLIISKNI